MNIPGLHKSLLVAALLTQGIAQAQNINPAPQHEAHQHHSPQELTSARIAKLISSPSPIANLRVPLLQRMGDAAAVTVQNIMKTRGSLSPSEQQNVVQILHKAFELPTAITKDSNRKPDASMAMLQQLSASTTDFALRLQIEDTKQFIFEATLPK
jgi:hypothetical protein